MTAMTILYSACALLSLAVIGWCVFSLASGTVLYLSMLTTNNAALETSEMRDAERASAMYAHTKDLSIMEPLEAAKARWYARREAGEIFRHEILSRDGLRLSGYIWMPEDQGNPGKENRTVQGRAVVLVHGFMDSAAGLGYLAEEYHREGWVVFAMDQRAHGESEGTKRTMGVREADDLALWIEWLAVREGSSTIVVHGISMGGGTALLYAGKAKRVHPAVRFIVSDSSFASYTDAMTRVLVEAVKSRFLAVSIVRGASVASKVFSGVWFGAMRPDVAARRVRLPVCFFHGARDVLVPIGSVRTLLNNGMKPGNECVVVPEAPHIGAYFYAPDLYMDKVREFSRRNT